jgi:hypothetical protein
MRVLFPILVGTFILATATSVLAQSTRKAGGVPSDFDLARSATRPGTGGSGATNPAIFDRWGNSRNSRATTVKSSKSNSSDRRVGAGTDARTQRTNAKGRRGKASNFTFGKSQSY